MLEAFKGLNILDPKFYIPVIIGVIVLFVIIKVAKKLIKLALIIAVIGLALLVYFNMPNIKLENGTAVLSVLGQEYRIDPKDVKNPKRNCGWQGQSVSGFRLRQDRAALQQGLCRKVHNRQAEGKAG